MPRGETKHLKKFQFKPGEPSPNPYGRPKEILPNALKNLTKQSLRRIIKCLVKGNTEHLKEIAEDPTSSVLEVAICNCIAVALKKGDYGTIEHILQRVLGKIPDEINLNAKSFNVHANAKVKEKTIREMMKKIEEEV